MVGCLHPRITAQVLSRHPSISCQDKLSYGRYNCQSLDSGVALDTKFIDYVQGLQREVPEELHQQAAYFLGVSMSAGIETFCPEHLPRLND